MTRRSEIREYAVSFNAEIFFPRVVPLSRARRNGPIKLTPRRKFKISPLFYEINDMHVSREQNEAHRRSRNVPAFYITTWCLHTWHSYMPSS